MNKEEKEHWAQYLEALAKLIRHDHFQDIEVVSGIAYNSTSHLKTPIPYVGIDTRINLWVGKKFGDNDV